METVITERPATINISSRTPKEKYVEEPLSRKEFIASIKRSQAEFERGEYKTDVWALEEEVRAYADRQLKQLKLR